MSTNTVGITPSKLPNTSGIYVIVNTATGRRYYGSTVKLRARKHQHWRQLRLGEHANVELQRAWSMYGADAFVFSVVEFVDREHLLEVEQRYIDLNTGGYNVAAVAGSCIGTKRSIASLKRMSAAQRLRQDARLITLGDRTMNLIDWCKERSLSPSAILQRINKLGWPIEKALSTPTWKRLTYDGATLTIKEWSTRTGIPVMTINARLWKGWSIERTLTTKPRHTKWLLTHDGRTQSARAWAKETGIPYNCIVKRLTHLGWSVADALTTPSQPKTRKAK